MRISLYRITVYKAWVLRNKAEGGSRSLYDAYVTLAYQPGMSGKKGDVLALGMLHPHWRIWKP